MSATHVLLVELVDLGDWSPAELRSEYDPQEGKIRINSRIAERLDAEERRAFILRCVAHELYHALEDRGALSALPSKRERESAAGEFAARICAQP